VITKISKYDFSNFDPAKDTLNVAGEFNRHPMAIFLNKYDGPYGEVYERSLLAARNMYQNKTHAFFFVDYKNGIHAYIADNDPTIKAVGKTSEVQPRRVRRQ